MATATPARADRKLQLKEIVDWLVEDGLLDPDIAAKLLNDTRHGQAGKRHPIVVVAELRQRAKKAPHALLTADSLTEWLAARLRLDYYHIDPLKIDLKAVTQV